MEQMEYSVEALQKISDAFMLPEGARTFEPFGNGHINSTFRITIEGAKDRYILQKINSYVFVKYIPYRFFVLFIFLSITSRKFFCHVFK